MSHRPPQPSRQPGAGRRVGLLSTFPPRLCGLASFAAALESELTASGDQVTVVTVDDGRDRRPQSRPSQHVLMNGSPSSVRETAHVLSRNAVAIVLHGYGIYGGTDGEEVLGVLAALTVPAIVVVHTVPAAPSEHQRSVLQSVCELAARVVVMTVAAGTRLTQDYAVDESKVVMIPHGATLPTGDQHAPGGGPASRRQLLTWGLLGPGKGIEHVIRAMALLGDLRPRIGYTVAGVTHPNVFAREGDRYRQSLIRESWATHVAGSISFDDTYRTVPELNRLISSSSIVVVPYDSTDQVTSGVLVEAIAAGRPVIATAFPHAVELLSDGAGILVSHGDPVALAAAIREAVSDPGCLEEMAAQARVLAPDLAWNKVATRYRRLCDDLSPVGAGVAT